MSLKRVLIFLCGCVMAQAGMAAPEVSESYFGQVILDIQVEGLNRIEKDAVLKKIVSRVGEECTAEHLRADIQSINSMGYFDEISVFGSTDDTHRVHLIYEVRERPVIRSIEFIGNDRLSTHDLKEVIQVKEWAILDMNRVREDVVLIQKHYEEKGFYLAKVNFELKKSAHSAEAQEGVDLVYRIQDHDKVQIKKITFLNNQKFSDLVLKSVFNETREGNFFSFVSGAGHFKESAFKRDLEQLRFWYLDQGYIQFKYENPVVTVSDDKKWMYISIYVDEGEPYQIGSIDFGGDLLFTEEQLHEVITMKGEENFSLSKRNLDIQNLGEKYQDLGYAFVNVIPRMDVHEDSRKIDIRYEFEKGHLVNFGEIRITGNLKTYDSVIRRELKIHEGELFSGSQLRISKENVERLGYFSPGEVIFHSVPRTGRTDVVDIEIKVKERNTGSIQVGGGYGSYLGVFFNAQIAESNFLGRGQSISLSSVYSMQKMARSFNLSFTEPYTFDTLWTTGVGLYSVKSPIPNRWITSRRGFDIRLGHPLWEYVYAYATYRLENTEDLYPDANAAALVPADSGILSSMQWSLVRDKRNNRFETTGGNYQSIMLETAGLGGDLKFWKLVVNNRIYQRIIGQLVIRNNTEVGHIGAWGERRVVPASQKFYLGGPGSLKGYSMFLLGPLGQTSQGLAMPLGGTFEAFSLFELEYPLIREAGIKIVAFFDVGNAWDLESPRPDNDPMILQTDVGFGLRWLSPFGPLRFEWGFPLNPRIGVDQPVCFQFFMGPSF